ncbi:hypothetical protein SAMN04488543_3880 [Friedmanniella luteola]|uniref:Uncharacterized protein n=1 Tax=Friedmanniella luteola TaxID=546871 RepID=A0A1H1ZMR3_9ACTN|nr:hypothetical protein [Friedmanniella luteola]SDT34974.1 hypothetical protein SAMN04488543_3880 [Friedmanniella luteola]
MANLAPDDRANRPNYGLEVATNNNCPAWCLDAVGHGYDDDSALDQPARWHNGFSADMQTAKTNRYGPRRHLSVSLAARETVDARTGEVLRMDRPEICLGGDIDTVSLTAAEARLLAQHLLKAAEQQSAIDGLEAR